MNLITKHERPGVYSSYEASTLSAAAGKGKTVAVVAAGPADSVGTVFSWTGYSRAINDVGRCELSDLARLAPTLLEDFTLKHDLDRAHIYFINTPYMDEAVRTALNAEAAMLGFRKVTWIPTGCVITCHGGPGAFGIVGSCGQA